MSERAACSSFSQHAWKKDLCVNCGRLRSAHADFPKPAKRLSKGNINYKVPETQTKNNTTEPQKQSTDTVQKNVDTAKRQATPPRVLEKTGLSEHKKPEDTEQTERSASAVDDTAETKADEEKEELSENEETNKGHYYHKYDITQKGASGNPVKPDVKKRNKEKESAKTAAFVHTFIPVEEFTLGREQKYRESIAESKKKLLQNQRVVEVAAAEQHVALPYTIVDVSTIPHDVDPDSLDTKPQTPNNPPAHPATVPRRNKPTASLSGHGTTPSPAKRKDAGARKSDDSQVNENTKESTENAPNGSSVQKENKKVATPMPTILYDDDHNRKDKVMSPNSQRKVAILIPSAPFPVSHVYEDIDDDDTNGSRQDGEKIIEGQNKVSTPIKITDSSKFDANMQAIAKNLDLKKEKKPESVRSNSLVDREEIHNNETNDVKQDKAKKTAGGGKGFLSRLFSKGNKNEESQSQEEVDTTATDKEASVVAKDISWTRSQSVDVQSRKKGSVPESGIGSPVSRVRKSVMRSESTKEESALQSELKNVLVKGAPKDDGTGGYQNAAVQGTPKGNNKDANKSPGVAKITAKSDIKNASKCSSADPKLVKKPEVAGKPDKLKKPEKAKKPETPPCDKKISVVIGKPSVTEKPQISPPKPVSPVKPKPTRRIKSTAEDKANEGTDSVTLTCDTTSKFIIPESPVSPGKLEISMPKLEQSTINVEMISSIYDSSTSSDQSHSPREPCSPREPQSPRDKNKSDCDGGVHSNKEKPETPVATVRSRPKSEFVKARSVKRMSAAPPAPPPHGGLASPPPTTRNSAISPLPASAFETSGLPDDVMTKSFERSFSHSTLPKRYKQEKPKMPDKLPPEKAARNRRQAKAEKNGTGRSATLTEGIHVEPNTIIDIHLKEKEKEKTDVEDTNYRGSKFFGRALPSPPSARRPQRDNVYEDIDVDDDGYYDDIVELTKSISIDSGASDIMSEDGIQPVGSDESKTLNVCGVSITDTLPVTDNVMTTSAEYLEPISRSESTSDDSLTFSVTSGKEKNVISPDHGSLKNSPTTPTTPTNYIDTLRWDPNGKSTPDNYTTGFHQMDIIHTRTLQSIVADVCWEPQVLHDRRQGRLKMTDFKMENKKPILSHSSCMFYKVSTTKLEEMQSCILMISQKKAPAALTNCNNMNILKPVAVFSENAQLDSKPGTYAQAATVGVFNFADISSLQDYLKKKFSNQPSVPHVKQNTVMYVLIQVLNGLLWMLEQSIFPRTLTASDILVVTSSSTSDQRLLLNPFRIKDAEKKLSTQDYINRLYADFVKLALSVINVEMASRADLSKVLRSVGYADHSMALSHVLCFQNDKKVGFTKMNTLLAAQQILEISLWGPSIDQMNTMLNANDPLTACHVWLALQRCTILSSHAVQGCSATSSWENTAYLNFLSTCNPETLMQVAQKITVKCNDPISGSLRGRSKMN